LARTREGELKPQSALTPEEVIDIERARQERTAVAGLRSSVAKPTGGAVPRIPKRTVIDANFKPAKVRDLMPHPTTPNPSRLDWLAGMSDDEIADAVVPESLEDMAAFIVQNSFKKQLLGARMIPQAVTAFIDTADSLERMNVNPQLVARIRAYAYREYSRQGSFSSAEMYEELKDFYDNLPNDTDSQVLQDVVNAVAAVKAYVDGEEFYESQLQDEYERMLQYLESVEVEEGYDFSPNAISEAKRVVKEALSTSDAYAWSVRTYGMPAIRVVTPESNKRAKDSGRRADVLSGYAGGWFGHGGEYLHGIAINLSERTTAQNVPSGPMNPVKGSPIGGFPTNPVPSNVSYSQADVLRHEWGHFFFYMATRRGAEELFVNAGWDRAEYQALMKYLKDTYDARKGNLDKDGSELRRRYAVPAGKLISLLEDPTQVAKTGATQKDVDGFLLQIANTLLKVSKGSGIFNFEGPLTQGDLRIGQVLTTGRISPNLAGLNFENPLFNLYAEMDLLNQRKNAPTTLSAYAFSNPQESWAEGIASFFSPLANVRALNTNAKRVDIARALGIDVQNGRHDKPWERRSSGLRSSTTEFESERGNIPVPVESQSYPPEVGGMRSRIALDKRAQTLGVDVSLFNDTSRDDDDVMWATNDWSLSKTERVEAGDAVIVREGEKGPEVLLVTRNKGPFRDSLALPGGMREGQEPLDRSASREAMEEVGIDSANAISQRLLGEIETRDWDPRFVEGGRVAGIRMDVADDVTPTIGDDATGFEWIPVSDIAIGKYSIAFGHATWIAEAFRNDNDLYEKLSILAEASRVRNRRIIASVDRERAKKGAKRFGKLPNPNAPYPTVYSERRLGLRSTTQSGVPYSLVLRNDEKLASLVNELRQQRDGVKDRINKLERARRDFKKTGNWNGGDIGVSLNTGGVPRNIDKDEIGYRNWNDIISEELDTQINRAKTFESQVGLAMDSSIETLRRRRNSLSIVEEFDDIRSDRKVYRSLEAATRDLAGMNQEQRRAVFNRDGGSYFALVADQDPNAPSSKKINLYRADGEASQWRGLYEKQEGGELVSVIGFTQRGDIDSPTDSVVAPILEGWAKNAVTRDTALRSSTRGTRISGRNFEEVFEELGLTDGEKDIARRALEVVAEDFSTGAIFNRPIHEALDADRGRLLNSIRIEVDDDGIPMLIADPNPLFFQFIPDKRDWSKVRLPSVETIEKVKQILQGNRNENRERVSFSRHWDSLYSELLDKVMSIPGSREYTPKSEDSFLELYVAGLNDPKATMVGEAGDIVVHDSFGHVGIGRGFDRHGEWANFLSTVSVVKEASPEQMSNEEKDSVLRGALVNYGVTQLTKNGADYMEWMGLVYDYEGNILDIIELLDTSDRTQVLNNDGSRPEGLRSRTGGEIVPFGQAAKTTLDRIADTDALRNKRMEVLYGDVVDFPEVQRRKQNQEKIDAIPEIYDYSRYLEGQGVPRKRAREIIDILEDAAVRNFDSEDNLEDFLADVRRRILSMIDRGLFEKGENERRSEDAEDWWYSQDAIERLTSKVLTSVIARDVEDSEKMDELVEMTSKWELDLFREVVDTERNKEGGIRSRTTSIIGKDFNEIAFELELSAKEQDVAEDELTRNMEEITTGRIFDRPLHDLLEKDKQRLLDSIRVEVSEEDGIPMLIADPNPLLFQYIPDKRDWSKVMVPKRETIKRVAKHVRENLSVNPMEEEMVEIDSPAATGFAAVDTFSNRLFNIVRSLSEKGAQKDIGMEVGDSWLSLYLGGLSNPATLVDALDAVAEQVHDAFGHAGIGRGFDRHGEWANPLAVISMLDHSMFDDFTPEMKNSVALYMMREFGVIRIEQRYGTGFGEQYDEDMDGGSWAQWLNYYTGDMRELVDMLDDSDKTQVLNDDGSRPSGMRSRTGKAPQSIGFDDLSKQQISEIAKNEGMHKKFNDIRQSGLRSKTPGSKQPRSVQEFDKSFEEKYGEEPQYGSGDCFFSAISKAQELAEAYDNVRVVHGVPLGTGGEAEGIRYPHAWVEFTQNMSGIDIEFIADFSNGNEVVVPKELYYKIGNIDPEFNRAYSIDEIEEKIEENGHAGPW
jgi:ADP-ribose pyrophosphatase YjhB (NUDIX family)